MGLRRVTVAETPNCILKDSILGKLKYQIRRSRTGSVKSHNVNIHCYAAFCEEAAEARQIATCPPSIPPTLLTGSYSEKMLHLQHDRQPLPTRQQPRTGGIDRTADGSSTTSLCVQNAPSQARPRPCETIQSRGGRRPWTMGILP